MVYKNLMAKQVVKAVDICMYNDSSIKSRYTIKKQLLLSYPTLCGCEQILMIQYKTSCEP